MEEYFQKLGITIHARKLGLISHIHAPKIWTYLHILHDVEFQNILKELDQYPYMFTATELTGAVGRMKDTGRNKWIHLPSAFNAHIVVENQFDMPKALEVICDIVKQYIPGIHIKYPNDIMLEGKKIGGIIVSRLGEHVAVGIGMNILTQKDIVPSNFHSYTMCSKEYNQLHIDIVEALQKYKEI